jgi:hypothetical protein
MTPLPLDIPPWLTLDETDRRRIAHAAHTAAQSRIDAIIAGRRHAWRARWDALAASVEAL